MRFAQNILRTISRARILLSHSRKFAPIALLAGASSLGTLAYSIANAPKAYAEHSVEEGITAASFLPKKSAPVEQEAKSAQMKRFLEFATLEYNGVAYMTPVDFLRCAVLFRSAPYGTRQVLDRRAFNDLVQFTPPLARSSPTFLRDLGVNGAISFTEYMFLMSVISHPRTGLMIAFRMFDRDLNHEVDIIEFQTITQIFCRLCTGALQPDIQKIDSDTRTSLLRHLFGKRGDAKLRFCDFSTFVDNLQRELLQVEFDHFSAGSSEITPVDLAFSMLRFAHLDSATKDRNMAKLSNDPALIGKTISFESYKALYDFLYVIDDFSSALKLFRIAKRSVSKGQFQRAARAVTGSFLDPLVVDVIFTLFDADGDGHLSTAEFIDCIRCHGMRYLVETTTSSRMEAFKRCMTKQLME